MLERTRRASLIPVVALLASACAGASGKIPYHAPTPAGAAAVDTDTAEKLTVLVVAEADPRIAPGWVDTVERAGNAVEAALRGAHFGITRQAWSSWNVRVTVSCPIRGADFEVRIEAKGKLVDRFEANGRDWDRTELEQLAAETRQRIERSELIAAIGGKPPRPAAAPAPAATTTPAPVPEPRRAWVAAATGPSARRRLAVLEFRGAGSPTVLALLADQAGAAAADAARPAGIQVLTRDAVARSLKAQGRTVARCADADCDLETGRALGADLVVSGEVSQVGGAQFLVLKLVDAASGALLASRHARATDDLALVEAAKPAAAALFE